MSTIYPRPLYPTYFDLKDMRLLDYPELEAYLTAGPEWRKQHWLWGADFLKYIGRNKSAHTYVRFRNETERFLLWAFMFKNSPIDGLRKSDILDYADFCWSPPVEWISLHLADRFIPNNGIFVCNPQWRPFRLKTAKNQQVAASDRKKYRPSQQSFTAMFTGLIAFYKYLMNEELCYGNPAQIAKKDCRHFIADSQVREVRRLSEEQWQYVLSTAEELAEQDSLYERSLFIIASLKTLFLRVSELSERPSWMPSMNHFWQDENDSWWLKVYGKGRKLRDVTVPTQYLDYLKRYRSFRGLVPLPSSDDQSPLVEKVRGQGGMTTRHITRLVQEVFDAAYVKMCTARGEDHARKLQMASTHWLRHTGASMEIERGRALKDLSEDLGHASMATTDTVYVQSENRKRAESGKGRKVD